MAKIYRILKLSLQDLSEENFASIINLLPPMDVNDDIVYAFEPLVLEALEPKEFYKDKKL